MSDYEICYKKVLWSSLFLSQQLCIVRRRHWSWCELYFWFDDARIGNCSNNYSSEGIIYDQTMLASDQLLQKSMSVSSNWDQIDEHCQTSFNSTRSSTKRQWNSTLHNCEYWISCGLKRKLNRIAIRNPLKILRDKMSDISSSMLFRRRWMMCVFFDVILNDYENMNFLRWRRKKKSSSAFNHDDN